MLGLAVMVAPLAEKDVAAVKGAGGNGAVPGDEAAAPQRRPRAGPRGHHRRRRANRGAGPPAADLAGPGHQNERAVPDRAAADVMRQWGVVGLANARPTLQGQLSSTPPCEVRLEVFRVFQMHDPCVRNIFCRNETIPENLSIQVFSQENMREDHFHEHAM